MPNTNKKTIYDPVYEEILTRLKKARKESGLRQSVVAEKIGKYKSYISKIEHGDRRIDIMELIDLAELYNKDINYFIKKENLDKK
jgi:transcriptional regulator with XRE-family HTH domain